MANIKEVAACATLSVACVSKYLKNPDSVRKASREKIEMAIKKLNYVPSSIARNLRTKRTGIIKIISHSITNPFFAELFELSRKKLEDLGYIAVLQVIGSMELLEFAPDDFEQIDEAVKQAKEYKDGPVMIIANSVKGKGVSFMEGVVGFHGRAPTPEEAQRALKELA